jgi:hypothetical protein
VTKFDKAAIIWILSVFTTVGSYAVWNLSQQKKLTKRLMRNAEFLAKSDAIKAKYPNGGDDEGRQMAAEIVELMKEYDL